MISLVFSWKCQLVIKANFFLPSFESILRFHILTNLYLCVHRLLGTRCRIYESRLLHLHLRAQRNTIFANIGTIILLAHYPAY